MPGTSGSRLLPSIFGTRVPTGVHGVLKELLPQVCHQVSCEGVHSDHHEGKGDQAFSAHFDDPRERAEHERHTPPVNTVQAGGQIRFTIRIDSQQMQKQSAAISHAALSRNFRKGTESGLSISHRPVSSPSSMVAGVGMKLSVWLYAACATEHCAENEVQFRSVAEPPPTQAA